jgi:Putative zinc-finger
MTGCDDVRLEMLDLLRGRMAPASRVRVEDHLTACAACTAELAELRLVWDALPESVDARPPAGTGRRILDYAARGVAAAGVWVDLRRVARDFVSPAVLGAAAAFVIVSLTALRGAMSPFDRVVSVAAALVLASLLAVVGGALLRGGVSVALRTVLLGALGAFGGYWVLDLAVPVSDAVRLCGLAVFGGGPMSLGQVCVVYLIIAGLYAGVPLAFAAYLRGGSGRPWRTGMAEASVFGALVIPLVILQTSPQGWMIAATVAIGVVMGAILGEMSGFWMRSRFTSAAVSV